MIHIYWTDIIWYHVFEDVEKVSVLQLNKRVYLLEIYFLELWKNFQQPQDLIKSIKDNETLR